jgi:hypothetical protein
LELLALSGGEGALQSSVPSAVPAKALASTKAPAAAPAAPAAAPAPQAAAASTPAASSAPISAEWAAMLAAADPATKPLLADARPSVADGVLTLTYAPEKRFLRGRAEGRRDRITALAVEAYGAALQVAFADLDPDAALREVWKD